MHPLPSRTSSPSTADAEFAETGHDGLRRANELQPDIALIDIGLPGLTGYEVARHIRSDSTAWAKKVKLVALTGYARDADRAEALEAGFDCHLVKPIDPDVLAEDASAAIAAAWFTQQVRQSVSRFQIG